MKWLRMLLAVALPLSGFPVWAEDDMTLDEVVVTGDLVEKLQKRGVLKESIIKTEVITETDMAKKQACTLAEVLEKEPGIDATTGCSMCGMRRVQINGLKGEYTTVLVDGVPLNSTVSSYYGFDGMNMAGIARVEVSRGSGASLIAPEAIGGVVNVVSKKAERTGMTLDMTGGTERSLSVVGTGVSEGGNARATAAAQYFFQNQRDADDNGVNETPARENQSAFLRYSRDIGIHNNLDLRATVLQARTFGGPMKDGLFETLAPSGAGLAFEDGDVRKKFTGDPSLTLESIFIRRTEGIGRWTHDWGGKANIVLTGSAARQNQDSFYEGNDYYNTNDTYFGDFRFNCPAGPRHVLTLGADSRYETLRSISHAYFDVLGVAKDDFDMNSFGVYVQDVWTPHPRVELSGAVRANRIRVNFRDQTAKKNEIDKTLVVPRVHLKWEHTDFLSSRVSFGRGYRAPLTFFESEHGILDDGFDVLISRLETSNSATYSLAFDTDRMTAALSAAWTEVDHMAYVDDENYSRPTLQNYDGHVDVRVVDGTMGYQLTPAFDIGAGYERFFYQKRYKALLPVAAVEERARLMGGWEKKGWGVDGTLNWVGSRDLAPYGYGDRYNVYDGTNLSEPKSTHAPSYATVDVQLSKECGNGLTFRVGVKNLFDYTQADKESPLFYDSAGGYDVGHIWGPLRGREVYAGVKVVF